MSDIFETIWNHPASHVSVSRRGPNGQFTDQNADILLEEVQSHGGNCIDEDSAPSPLFHRVNESLFTQPTFQTFIALLDNYTAVEGREERSLSDPGHKGQVDAFVDTVLATEPMKLAIGHVREHLRPQTSDDAFRDLIRRIWFEPFTNKFSGTENFCVGFEHVFVGEDASRANSAPRCEDNVGGFHSWVKCYLDEKSGRVNYLGHDYPNSIAEAGLADPHIATLIMTWIPSAEEGGHGHTLLKKPGGFFVGTRPECEIALGTVGLLMVLADQFDNTPGAGTENHRRVKLGDSFFDLVLHPQTIMPRRNGNPAQLGEHIRTMYPKFRGSADVPSGGDGGGINLPTQPHNNAAIRIVRALPNPPGLTDQGEWVELENVSSFDFDLSEWQLRDEEGRVQPMSGTLASGQVRRIDLTRAGDQPMMLRNRGGWILLFQEGIRRAAVRYSDADQGEIFTFA
jgi:poly(U)-specific endoribonuclease